MSKIEKVLLTGKTHTVANRREGGSRVDHARLDIKLSTPQLAQGDLAFAAVQAHPTAEQFFAGAWSACFTGALDLAAQARKVTLPADLAVDIEVDLGQTGSAYFLQARIDVTAPGLAQDLAEELVRAAHGICPYSKAVAGNIDVSNTVRTA
jgi:Ohr subfamily peroxiredoxin